MGENQNPEYWLRGPQPSDIVVDGNTVEQVDNFVYLGSAQSCQSSDGGNQVDIRRRIALASSVVSLRDESGAIDTSLPTKI